MSITIEEFYKNNQLDYSFDEILYLKEHPDVEGFYQPYCKDNAISEKHRLFFHYNVYTLPYLNHSSYNNNCIYLKPTQGLGNRLLTLDSVYAFAREFQYNKIYLCWVASKGFSDETFDELFDINKLPPNIVLIDEKEYEDSTSKFLILDQLFEQNPETLEYHTQIDKPELLSSIKEDSFCLNSYASIDWIFGIQLKHRYDFLKNYLEPSLELQQYINKYNVDKNYVGIHIRKGDAIIGPWAEHYKESKDEYFENIIRAYADTPIFLSTDSEEAEKYYIEKFKNIVVSDKNFVDPSLTVDDHKPLQKEAVIDMFLLSKTRQIYGTNWSTFNQISSILGDINLELLTDKTQTNLERKTNISVVTVTKNRSNILKTSINSWLIHNDVQEIVIVDYSSDDFDKEYFENLDPRIKIIQVKGEKYFNLSKAYNIAIDNASHDMILKLDVDYIINPYNSLSDWLLIDSDKSFITGNWRENTKDNKIGFLEHLNGFCFIDKKHLIQVDKYQGNQHGYGYDDCDLYKRLERMGLQRITIKFNKNFVPIFHIPHSDDYRSKYYENKNIVDSLQKNMSESCA